MRRSASHVAHAPYLLLLAAASILWTWPLVLHFRTHVPGNPGDNFSFLWNFWWMRHVLAAHPPSGFFHPTYLFFPFGVDLVNHPHTALPSFISATLLSTLTIIQAENLYIVVSLFLNGAVAYALAYDLGRRRRLALLAGLAFGGSPYIAAHLMGHFDLLSAWVIPAFALVYRRALMTGNWKYAAAAGVFVAVAAYSAYYYVVYLALLAVAYTMSTLLRAKEGIPFSGNFHRREHSPRAFTIRLLVVGALSLDLFLMMWIWMTGGTTLNLGVGPVSLHGYHNPLGFMWLLLLIWVLARWKITNPFEGTHPEQKWRAIHALTITAAAFTVLSLPLIVQAFRLLLGGRYVTQVYFWRSAPAGVDVSSFFTGNPFHPLIGATVRKVYAAFELQPIEQVAWLGVVPLALLLTRRGQWIDREEARRWRIVLGAFVIWSLGPFLTMAGRNLGMPLPETLARFIPIVENARVPGRAMVGVYLALGVLMALRVGAGSERTRPTNRDSVRAALFEWALIAALAVDFLSAPIPLTALDRPAIYEQLAAVHDDSPVIELPFGIGDGLSVGIGNQDRRILYYATIHEHPLLGGYIGRMPPGVADAYAAMPVVGNFLRLSSGQPATDDTVPAAVPFRYIVLDTTSASTELVAYMRDTLDVDLIGSSDGRELYAVQGVKPPGLRASR
jgi:hypothetical protein